MFNQIQQYWSKLIFRIKYRSYLRSKIKNSYNQHPSLLIRKLYEKKNNKGQNLIIATQVGRGGGKWLCDILNSHKSITAFGERNRLIESQYRFKTSYGLLDNYDPFMDLLKSEALTDWGYSNVSYISSPYFSHGLDKIFDSLEPKKVLILLSKSFKVAVSLYNKGWYLDDIALSNDNKISHLIPPQFAGEESHYYGRYIKINIEVSVFNSLTRLGKIAVYMSSSLDVIATSLYKIPVSQIYLFCLEKHDQNYKAYINMMTRLEISPELSKRKFMSLKKRTSGNFENIIPDFTSQEINEFERHIALYDKRYKELINLYQ